MNKNGYIRASHILISHNESNRKPPNVERTKSEAKKLANNLYRQILRKNSKFETLADEISDGPSISLGGDLGFFNEKQLEPASMILRPRTELEKLD